MDVLFFPFTVKMVDY